MASFVDDGLENTHALVTRTQESLCRLVQIAIKQEADVLIFQSQDDAVAVDSMRFAGRWILVVRRDIMRVGETRQPDRTGRSCCQRAQHLKLKVVADSLCGRD